MAIVARRWRRAAGLAGLAASLAAGCAGAVVLARLAGPGPGSSSSWKKCVRWLYDCAQEFKNEYIKYHCAFLLDIGDLLGRQKASARDLRLVKVGLWQPLVERGVKPPPLDKILAVAVLADTTF
jgi:hypothetical protein